MSDLIIKGYVDLANPRLGSKIISKTDEFFASADRLIDPAEPVFKPEVYDDHGKWMDGWETRRRRTPGYDHLVLRLGKPGRIAKVILDTAFFTGNFPEEASVEGAYLKNGDPDENNRWTFLVEQSKLKGDSVNKFKSSSDQVFTHIRLNIFPDGGVARMRLMGKVAAELVDFGDAEIDLAAMENGGTVLACNNEHYGVGENILAPGKGKNMGDGWETRRRRSPGHDWIIVSLAKAGSISRILVDTHHFKGNYPDRCLIKAANLAHDNRKSAKQIADESADWPVLLPESKLEAHAEHKFAETVNELGAVTHLRVNIYPDGGISRLRAIGKASKS